MLATTSDTGRNIYHPMVESGHLCVRTPHLLKWYGFVVESKNVVRFKNKAVHQCIVQWKRTFCKQAPFVGFRCMQAYNRQKPLAAPKGTYQKPPAAPKGTYRNVLKNHMLCAT